MSGTVRRLSLAALIGAAAVLGGAAVLVAASPAFAHNYYVSSTPEEGEVLTSLPEEFVVTTNDDLLDLGGAGRGFLMQVEGEDGLYYGDGCVTVSGPSVSMAAALGPAGDYTLGWQAISADGHTISGEVPFRWEPSAPEPAPASGAAAPPRCGEEAAEPGSPGTGGPGADDSTTDALWIGGAIVAVAITVVATLLLLRPRRKPAPSVE